MTDDAKADREALEDLVTSKGWSLFTQMVKGEIHDEFEEHVMRQLSMPDSQIAIERARQVLAVRQAGERWLKLPKLRLEQLSQAANQDQMEKQKQMLPGRRPLGL